MKIIEVKPNPDYTLRIISDDGRTGIFDVSPYLEFEAFADLSADTIEAHLISSL